ncbi:GNAT family N-acetyltransferase [Psychrobacillus soli]|uniref:GNAT family N-acetyltransferase n=1 Tax=Psychrobacillus soli TaxID=1543965 RepID=A0A544TDN1_9BACI|nr:GNAT family N-acetyltransferase [Psychrobacillus soli]TQR15564.1 GNAT family N-acetyltransferase [Psychrobacillus soli]
MIIREMQFSDIESVSSIAARTWKDTYSAFIPEEIQGKVLTDAYSSETMEKRFKSSITLVAENKEEIMGYAFFSSDTLGKDVFLESLYVHPDHQGKKVGKQLLHAGLSKFEDPTTISLTVYNGNPNITIYERIGFKVIEENKGNFYGHPMVFILMKRNLIDHFK